MIRSMQIKSSIFLLIVSSFLVGCSNYKELNQLAIVLAMGIDYNEEAKLYDVTLQFVNPRGVPTNVSPGATDLAAFNVKGSGQTITEAAIETALKLPRKNLFYHTSLIVVGEALAKKGISPIMDIFEREPKIRTSVPVILARDVTANELLNIIPVFDKIPSKSLVGKLENTSDTFGGGNNVTVYKVISQLKSLGSEPVISGASVKGDKKIGSAKSNLEHIISTYTYYNGMGIFHDGKLVGWIDGEKVKTIPILAGKLKTMNITVPCGSKDQYQSILVSHSKRKIKVEMKRDVPDIGIDVFISGYLSEALCKEDISKETVINDIQKRAENVMKTNIEQAIQEAQTLHSDIFGFGEVLYRSDPKTWKQVKGKWNELFSKANVAVKVEMDLEHTGMTTKHF